MKYNILLTKQKAFTEIQLGRSGDRQALPTPTVNTPRKFKQQQQQKAKPKKKAESQSFLHTRKSLKKAIFLVRFELFQFQSQQCPHLDG